MSVQRTPRLTGEAAARQRAATLARKAGRWGGRRPTVAAALLYLVLSLAMFAPGLAPGRTLSASDYLWTATPWAASRPAEVPALGSNRELADSVSVFQPALLTTRAALPDIPLWDPYTLSGRPFLGDPQSAVISPFSIPAYLLPFWKSLAVMAALKLFVAALGAFLFGREVQMRFGGALLTGLVFGFSLWSVTWVSWPHGSVWALFPWLCLFSERCVRRPGLLSFAGLAATVGLLFLAGHPASALQALAVAALVWTVRAAVSRPPWRLLGRRLLTLACALVAGTALAAVALLPFAELLAHSNDATARAETSDLLHQPPRYLLGIFLHDYWGHARSAVEFGTGLVERAYYVAALPLMLAAAALVVRPRRAPIAAAAVAAGALAVAAGMPPLYDLLVALPGFAAANNGRFAVVSVLCLAVLAGWGLDELTRSRLGGSRRRRVLAAGFGVLLLPGVVVIAGRDTGLGALGEALGVAWGFQDAEPHGAAAVIRLASLLEWLVLGVAALALIVLRVRGRLGVPAFVALAALLVAVDLFKAGMDYNPAIPLEHAVQPTTPAIRFLQSQSPERFAALDVRTPLSLAYPFPPNVAMRHEVQDVRGYVIPIEERYFELWRRAIAPSSDCYYLFCTQAAPARPRALNALGLLGVSHLLQHHEDSRLPKLRSAYAGRDARIYVNPGALPRAFLVDRQLVVSGAEAALTAVTSPGFRARTVAVTERKISDLSEETGAPTGPPGRARVAAYEPERVNVEARANRAALLVLTDTWFPGWKATVDGEPVPIHRVDYVIRGVSVPPGAHRVEFRYEPASWRAGWIISAVALLGIAGAAGVGWRRRPRAG